MEPAVELLIGLGLLLTVTLALLASWLLGGDAVADRAWHLGTRTMLRGVRRRAARHRGRARSRSRP